MSTEHNILLMTDSYKVSHWKQYPPGTTHVFSYLESRGGAFSNVTFFGLSYIIQKYLTGPVVTREKIEEAATFFADHFGDESLFNRAGWEHILNAHGGHLPVIIRAVPEGTVVPIHNVLMTIENTDPAVPWLVNYLETPLAQVWYPTTVATQSREMKIMIQEAMEKSGADMHTLPFKLQDFGYRGSTSHEAAGIGGAAHLVNFLGTDTMAALEVAQKYYFTRMAGFSIPAAEHSTITAWGRENEAAAYENMLDSYPKGLVAVVSDSYDVFNAVENIWGDKLRDKVLARDGVVVIRPDSGPPVETILELLHILGDKFGITVNTAGYKVLNPKVRLIQGDGIDREMLRSILNAMLEHKWSIDNIAFGSGGGLLQKVNRDTCRFAMKCSAVEINGEWHNVSKNPIGDTSKMSKAGRLSLAQDEYGFYTVTGVSKEYNHLEVVFSAGIQLGAPTLEEIRMRAGV